MATVFVWCEFILYLSWLCQVLHCCFLLFSLFHNLWLWSITAYFETCGSAPDLWLGWAVIVGQHRYICSTHDIGHYLLLGYLPVLLLYQSINSYYLRRRPHLVGAARCLQLARATREDSFISRALLLNWFDIFTAFHLLIRNELDISIRTLHWSHICLLEVWYTVSLRQIAPGLWVNWNLILTYLFDLIFNQNIFLLLLPRVLNPLDIWFGLAHRLLPLSYILFEAILLSTKILAKGTHRRFLSIDHVKALVESHWLIILSHIWNTLYFLCFSHLFLYSISHYLSWWKWWCSLLQYLSRCTLQ